MPRIYPAMPDRFWSKVDRRADDECWNWTGSTSPGGYGRIKMGAKNTYAHRVSLSLVGVEIPAKMHVDHLCENTRCVNPAHLDVVSCRENHQRSRDVA